MENTWTYTISYVVRGFSELETSIILHSSRIFQPAMFDETRARVCHWDPSWFSPCHRCHRETMMGWHGLIPKRDGEWWYASDPKKRLGILRTKIQNTGRRRINSSEWNRTIDDICNLRYVLYCIHSWFSNFICCNQSKNTTKLSTAIFAMKDGHSVHING